jgi:D-alanyl-D-alanine carboxypeptidase
LYAERDQRLFNACGKNRSKASLEPIARKYPQMKNRRSLVLLGLLLLSIQLSLFTGPAYGYHFNARSAILIETTTGKVLFEQNPDALIPPASVTKLMTLYLVYEAMREGRAHPWDSVKISKRAAGTVGSRMHVRAGTEVPLEELIKGMAVDSGNDACVAAGEHISGSVEDFVVAMNRKARELGMTNSYFVNPNGLPAKGQVTTARDMARLSAAYLQRFPESLRVHSMRCYTYNNITQHNRNRLLGTCPGVDGLKTGWIVASGYNLAATAKRGDTRLLAVLLGAPTPGARAEETARLLEHGFQRVASNSPESLRTIIAEPVPVNTGTGEKANQTVAGVSGKQVTGKEYSIVRTSPPISKVQPVQVATRASSAKGFTPAVQIAAGTAGARGFAPASGTSATPKTSLQTRKNPPPQPSPKGGSIQQGAATSGKSTKSAKSTAVKVPEPQDLKPRPNVKVSKSPQNTKGKAPM